MSEKGAISTRMVTIYLVFARFPDIFRQMVSAMEGGKVPGMWISGRADWHRDGRVGLR